MHARPKKFPFRAEGYHSMRRIVREALECEGSVISGTYDHNTFAVSGILQRVLGAEWAHLSHAEHYTDKATVIV
jgi:hypothetical protein